MPPPQETMMPPRQPMQQPPMIHSIAIGREPNIPINSNGKVSATYEGFLLTPDAPLSGETKPTWARANNERLEKTQTQLAKMVRDKDQDAKKFLRSSAMEGNKKKQVERLIEKHMELEEPNSQFEWEPAMIKLNTPPSVSLSSGKAKSMVVIIKRLPKVMQLPRRPSSGSAGRDRDAVISDLRIPTGHGADGGPMPRIPFDHHGYTPSPMGSPISQDFHPGPEMEFAGARPKYPTQRPMSRGPPGMPGMPPMHHHPGQYGHHTGGPPLMGPHPGHMHGGPRPDDRAFHGEHHEGRHPPGPHDQPGHFVHHDHKGHGKEAEGGKPGKKEKGGKEGKGGKKEGKDKKDKHKPEIHQKIDSWHDRPSDSEVDSVFSDDNSIITPGSSVSSRCERRYSSNREPKYSPDHRNRRDSSAKGHREHKRRDPQYLGHEGYVLISPNSALRRTKTDAAKPAAYNGHSDGFEDEFHKSRREQRIRDEMEAERRLGKLEGKIETLQMVDREERVRDLERERELREREHRRARDYAPEPQYRAPGLARNRDVGFPRNDRFRDEPRYRPEPRYQEPRYPDPHAIFDDRPHRDGRYGRDPSPAPRYDRYRNRY